MFNFRLKLCEFKSFPKCRSDNRRAGHVILSFMSFKRRKWERRQRWLLIYDAQWSCLDGHPRWLHTSRMFYVALEWWQSRRSKEDESSKHLTGAGSNFICFISQQHTDRQTTRRKPSLLSSNSHILYSQQETHCTSRRSNMSIDESLCKWTVNLNESLFIIFKYHLPYVMVTVSEKHIYSIW